MKELRNNNLPIQLKLPKIDSKNKDFNKRQNERYYGIKFNSIKQQDNKCILPRISDNSNSNMTLLNKKSEFNNLKQKEYRNVKYMSENELSKNLNLIKINQDNKKNDNIIITKVINIELQNNMILKNNLKKKKFKNSLLNILDKNDLNKNKLNEKRDDEDKFDENKIVENEDLKNNNKEQNKNVKLKIFGLVNHNNYCFMNSSLQIFFHLEQFVEKIVNIKLNNNNQLLSIEIQNILKITENNSIADPIKIKNIINSIQPEYKNDDQEDAFELITIFLEQLKQELKNIDNNYKPNININDNDELNAWNKFKKRHIDKYNSFIWELFYGIIKKEIICEKKHRILINYIPFNIIELPQFNENITLINLIEYFQKENEVFAEYECNKCGEIDKYFIKKTIITLPKYLLIYSDKNKIKTINEIKYKDIIKEESKNNDIYQLKGLIGYNGNSYSGHYYSRCKIYNDWYYFSDSNFKKIETPNISQNDIILVFELKTN